MFSQSATFISLIDKATDRYLMEPDWETNLCICDYIRQGTTTPQLASYCLYNKLRSLTNTHSKIYFLVLIECIAKNCGSMMYDELLLKSNLDDLYNLAMSAKQEIVRNKVLEILQTWSVAMKTSKNYSNLKTLIMKMKQEKVSFPDVRENDAMFSTEKAPNWTLSNKCNQCRQMFSLFKRRHHCRACGEAYCHECSQYTSIIPKYGFEKEVRVCNNCYDDLNKSKSPSVGTPLKAASKTGSELGTSGSKNLKTKNNDTSNNQSTIDEEKDLPKEYLESSLSKQSQVPARKSEEEIREEEELELALALSKSELEQNESRKQPYSELCAARESGASTSTTFELESNPELARYLNRPYWESKQLESGRISPSAPTSLSITSSNSDRFVCSKDSLDENPKMNEFIKSLRTQVDIFVNRMKSNSSRGRFIANDTSVQSLFTTITAMHSDLLQYIQEYDDKRVFYEDLQDKMVQVKDARAALDALRDEHRENLRQEAAEAEKLRQMQMAQKLQMMRQKKEEYLEYQRQLALQQIQKQEQEMMYRKEQQKQYYATNYHAMQSQTSSVIPLQMSAQGSTQLAAHTVSQMINQVTPQTVAVAPANAAAVVNVTYPTPSRVNYQIVPQIYSQTPSDIEIQMLAKLTPPTATPRMPARSTDAALPVNLQSAATAVAEILPEMRHHSQSSSQYANHVSFQTNAQIQSQTSPMPNEHQNQYQQFFQLNDSDTTNQQIAHPQQPFLSNMYSSVDAQTPQLLSSASATASLASQTEVSNTIALPVDIAQAKEVVATNDSSSTRNAPHLSVEETEELIKFD